MNLRSSIIFQYYNVTFSQLGKNLFLNAVQFQGKDFIFLHFYGVYFSFWKKNKAYYGILYQTVWRTIWTLIVTKH